MQLLMLTISRIFCREDILLDVVCLKSFLISNSAFSSYDREQLNVTLLPEIAKGPSKNDFKKVDTSPQILYLE